jgi:hypothetical protein
MSRGSNRFAFARKTSEIAHGQSGESMKLRVKVAR